MPDPHQPEIASYEPPEIVGYEPPPKVELGGVNLTPAAQIVNRAETRLGSAVAAPFQLAGAAYDAYRQHLDAANEAAKSGDYGKATLHLLGATPPAAVGQALLYNPSKDQYEKAKKAYEQGDKVGMVGHALAMFPFLGPLVGNITENVMSGDPLKQTDAAVDVATMLAPELLPNRGVRVPGLVGGNAAEQASVAYAAGRGIPQDAATTTQNAFVKGVQALADKTIGGSFVAKKAQAARDTAIGADLERVAGQVHPTNVTPEGAGGAIRSGTRQEMATQKGVADTAYDRLRTIEASTPAMVVDYTNLKRILQPVRDQMRRQLPETVRAASGGYQALEQILTGPDRVPLSVADMDRSVLNQVAHESDPYVRSFGQGIASKTARVMDLEIQAAAARGGPDAVAALQEGRKATVAKYAAAKSLRDYFGPKFDGEPVRAFSKATERNDAGIERLERLSQTNPDALPQIGRAYLDDLAEMAKAEGGFGHTDKLWSRWQDLGPRTKNLLFKDPQLVKDLDQLFLFAKRASENVNPSGTAHQGAIAAQATGLLLSPYGGIHAMGIGGLTQVAGATVSKLLRTPAGIRALRDGFMLPLTSQASKRAIQTVMAAQSETQPVQ